jgi:phosphatidylserine/phosphatidylglycerophosphate/cardiolipin synthase-like enzyme
MTTLPLSQLTPLELEGLRKAITRRQVPTPLSSAGLESIGKRGLVSRLGPLMGAGEEVALALIELALAQRPSAPVAAPAGLACTVPDPTLLGSGVRPTTPVLLELLGGAQKTVVIAGYELDYGAVLFQPLHRAMAERGVTVTIYLDVAPAPSPHTTMDAYLAIQAHRFLTRNWPFGPPLPALYHWPAGCAHGSRGSLHAKCVVVDGVHVMLGSANFTSRGHQRNLEVGVRLDDPVLATTLEQQLGLLAARGVLVPLHAPSMPAPPLAAEDDHDEVIADDLLVTAAARPLFDRLIARGLPVPTVGEDVEDDRGEVLGSPELTWEAARVAVLLPEQEGSRKKLEAAGWTCFLVALDDAELEALDARVRRR